MVFGFHEHKQQYDQAYNDDHKGSLSHEVLAGAASFAALKHFEDDRRKDGQPVKHQFAKEALAAFAGAEADKLAETKGLNAVDREKVKRQAQDQAQQQYDNQYGNNGDSYDPNSQGGRYN